MSRGILTGAFTATVLIRPNFHSEKTEPWGCSRCRDEFRFQMRCSVVQGQPGHAEGLVVAIPWHQG